MFQRRTCDCGFVFDLLGVTQYLLSSCRPEEQREDYREQLLSTAVKPRQTFPHHHLLVLLLPAPVSAHQPVVHSGWLQKSSRESATRFSFSVFALYSSWRLSCAKFIKSHMFAFVRFSRFIWLPNLLYLVKWPFVHRPPEILNCANMKYLNHWKEIM